MNVENCENTAIYSTEWRIKPISGEYSPCQMHFFRFYRFERGEKRLDYKLVAPPSPLPMQLEEFDSKNDVTVPQYMFVTSVSIGRMKHRALDCRFRQNSYAARAPKTLYSPKQQVKHIHQIGINERNL